MAETSALPTSAAQRERLAQRIRAGRRAAVAAAPSEALEAPEEHGPAPLSPGQERLWYLARLAPDSPAYGFARRITLDGPLDAAALAWALAEIVRRHPVLSTVFAEHAGRPVQLPGPPYAPLGTVDLSGLAAARAEADRLSAAAARRPLSLTSGRPLRALLVCLGPGEHRLELQIHHIVFDGWSLGILLRDLAALYRAAGGGGGGVVPEAPVLSYAAFARWQREALGEERRERLLAHWRRRLHGAPELLELPADRQRPPALSLRGARRSAVLSAAGEGAVADLAAEGEVTPFLTLLTLFAALLFRITGQEKAVVGVPVAGRLRREHEGLIGFFVNTLPVCLARAGDPPFRALLAAVRDALLADLDHQELPFERLVAELRPGRSLSHNPLFQALFVLQEDAAARVELPGLELGVEDVDSGAAALDWTFEVARGRGGYRLTLVYSTDLFDAPTAERALAHFATLLAGAAAEPGRALSALPLLTPAERFQVLAEWNDTAVDSGPAVCLHHLVAAWVRERPGAVAVVHGEERVTYAELWARAEELARYLSALGVGPESLVAVCAERSPALVAGLLGVLAAGGAYVPVDPAYPPTRSAQILEDCGAAVLLTEERLLPRLPRLLQPGARTVLLDAFAAAGQGGGVRGTGGARDRGVGGENLAYVIYTSGSLGRPKGVAIRHAAIVARLRWSAAAFSAAEMAGVLAATSVCFDLSVWELFAPLSRGGTVILAANALELPALPARGDVRLVNTVPSVIAELVSAGALPAGVRTVSLAGEPLPAALVRRLAGEPGVRRVWNLYGPSEDTTYSTGAVMMVMAEAAAPPIGRPLPGTRTYVVDRWLAPLPAATPGELLIAGAGLSRGYLGRPDLTAERFLPDPFAAEPGARLYRTGDLVRTRTDGSLEFLGRIDHQVKMRGFRIELGEIEEVLREHPAVAEAAVVVREDAPGDPRLVAYAVAAGEAADLRRFLKSRLPDYMVPSVFVLLAALPLTPNGKVDRRGLPAPAGAQATMEPTAPRTPVEEMIAAIWSEVLGVAPVGREDDFFQLGGHSLKAMQVLSRVREALQVELTPRRLLEEPTVAGLAGAVEAARRAGAAARRPPLAPVRRTGDLPLSFAQQRLWFLDQLEEGRPVYNLASAVRLTGPLDVPALAGALRTIGRRHETLRTSFHRVAGEGVQRIAPAPRLELVIEDLAALPAGARQEHLARRLRAEAWRPFVLAAGSLVRARLFRLAAGEHALLLSFHHIIADGWSLGVLYRELAALYAALSERGERPAHQDLRLAALPVQYADYAAWQRSWLQGDALAALLAAARRRLEGAPALLEMPADRPRPPVQSERGAHAAARLPPELSRGVEALGRRRGATLFMTLLAAFDALLWRWSGQEDLVLGFPVAGRDRRETEGVIGFFVNTLAVRQRLAGTVTFGALLAAVRENFLAAYDGQDLPFERLVEELVPGRDRGRTPLFQALLTVQEAPLRGVHLPGLALAPLAVPIDYVKCDLTLGAEPGDSGLRLSLSYAADLFDATTAGRLLAHLGALLESAAGDPERPLEDLPWLGAAEAHQVLVEWNDTALSCAGEPGVHALFAAQAARSPRAPALEWAGGALTYTELAAHARRLVDRLRAQGVGPESRVGVCLERSPELVVALLGILQAGGAYVPLDPAAPPERLRLLLAATGTRIVVAAEALPDSLAESLAEIVDLVRIERGAAIVELRPENAPEAGRDSGTGGDHLASVMLTSGSTGTPKAVGITHRNILRLVRAPSYARLGPREVMLQLAPASFDASTFEIWGCLLHGGRLVLAPPAPPTLAELGGLLERHGVTTLWLTAGLFHQAAERAEQVLSGVRQLLAGGDALSAAHVRRALAAMGTRDPGARLVNGYGPTECTTFACCQTFAAGAADEPLHSVPIGRPIGDTEAYVLDAVLRPVPLGVAGELCLGGAGLARGYLEDPQRTAERFVPHPFSRCGAERLYRTGDRVRWTGRGRLEFLGRLDRQIKVRGFRVEPGEIEAALLTHPEVAEAAVVARPDPAGDKSLVACVVAAARCAPSPASLREHLARRLPPALVPSRLCVLSELPLTANGKVDSRALLAAVERSENAAAEPGAAGPSRVLPRNPVEETLAGFWAALLGRREVGVDDDFFALGGHSLLAIQLVSRVRDAFGVELPLGLLFESPTVAALAEVIVRRALEQAPAGDLEDLLNDLEEPLGSSATDGPGGARLS